MCGHDDHVVTTGEVQNAIRLLNKGKHGGSRKIYTDHLIHSSDKLRAYLAKLFAAMLTHAYAPQDFRESSFDNYRGITLSSILGKVLDHILMSKNKNVFFIL
jgi:phosphoribosylpyrophosphate synthetase